ncbi:MAG: hypothetical protein RBR53_03775 [Desulforegulaceae bacterium]|nr:hypothetical protein [Desulforegulaceae bacterium]
MRFFKFLFIFYLFFVIAFASSPVFSQEEELNINSALETTAQKLNEQEPSPEILKSIASLRKTIIERIIEKQKLLKTTSSASEISNLNEEIKILDKQLHETQKDFERIATQIDISLFAEKKEEQFDWKNEIVSLIEPGISELKRITEKSRQKSVLKDEIERFDELLPYAETAVKNIKNLIQTSEDKSLTDYLENLLKNWTGIKKQIENKKHIANLKLKQMEAKEKSFVDATQSNVKNFFKTKGLFILTAIAISIMIVLFLRLIHNLIAKKFLGYDNEQKPFHYKAFELGYRVFTFLLTMISIILVFYVAQDWTLLSFAIIFLLGLAWGLKNTIPKMFKQTKLMLNVGAVREGERINYLGVPWIVQDINFYSKIENPDLGITLRIPIEILLDKVSRPNNPDDPFFPCRLNEWVILSDKTRGQAVSLSHEMVKLALRGGAIKTYQTSNFLSQSPLNLSRNYRIKETFCLSYNHQNEITDKIPNLVDDYINKKMKETGYDKILLKLETEFQNIGSSSLDLVIKADFKGEAADIYNKLRRHIQKWCVEASIKNNWEIPFPQLTIHNLGN